MLLAVIIVGLVCKEYLKNMRLTDVVSTIDNKTYRVIDLPDKQDASNKLSDITNALLKIVDYVYTHDPEKEGVKQLKTNFNSDNIIENESGGKYTAYSVNKGEQLAFCLRNAEDKKFIDNNLILFVAIHELAHVMTDDVGHTDKFWANMKYLLEVGEKLGVYVPEDYDKNPQMYCGEEINSTPYEFN